MALMVHPTSGLLLVGSPAQGGTGLLAVSQYCCCPTGSGGDLCPTCSSVPDTLYGRYLNATGDGVNLPPGGFTMTREVGTQTWQGTNGSYYMPCHGTFAHLTMQCTDPCTFKIFPAASYGEFNGTAAGATMTVVSLSPLLFRVTATITPLPPSTCSGSVTVELKDSPF